MIEKLNFLELQSMVAINKASNLATASEIMNIPKSTMQKHLESVERKLGEKLFDRKQKTGAMVPTTYGVETLPKIENILWIAKTLSIDEKFSSGIHNEGEVSIKSTQTILECYIVPYLAQILKENPKLGIFLKQRDENYYSQPAMNEIFIGAWDDNPDVYEYFHYHTFTQKLWASEEYLKNNPPINELKDLKSHTLLALRSINETSRIISHDAFMRKLGILRSELKVVNIAGPRIIDVAAEKNCGILVTAPETVKVLGLKVKPVLPDLVGDSIEIYVKINKKFLKWPVAKFMVDWIFKCRDIAMKECGIDTEPHTPLFQG